MCQKFFILHLLIRSISANLLLSVIETLRDNLLDIRNKARNGNLLAVWTKSLKLNLLGFYIIKAIGKN